MEAKYKTYCRQHEAKFEDENKGDNEGKVYDQVKNKAGTAEKVVDKDSMTGKAGGMTRR